MNEKIFRIVLVRFDKEDGDSNNVDSIPVKEWKLNLMDTYKLFMSYAEAHEDAKPDTGTIDSIMFSENGKQYSLFVSVY